MSNYFFQFYLKESQDRNKFNKHCDQFQKIAHGSKTLYILIDGFVSNFDNYSYLWDNRLVTEEEKFFYINEFVDGYEKLLQGSFNIIFYDTSINELKIIRDQIGTRCFYYSVNKEVIFFSSSIRIILEKIPKPTLNISRLIDYLNFEYHSNINTFYNEILRLEPSSIMTIIDSDISIKSFEPSYDGLSSQIKGYDKESFELIFKNTLSHLPKKNFNIGLMLSGGLDSSAVAVQLKNSKYQNVTTYSANYLNEDGVTKELSDESSYQKNVTTFTRYPHKFHDMSIPSIFEEIIHGFKIFYEPVFMPNMYIYNEIIKSLQKDNIDIILDGNDGDNVISHGYEILYEYVKAGRIFKYFSEIRNFSKVTSISFFRSLKIFLRPLLMRIFSLKTKLNQSLIIKEEYKLQFSKNNYDIYSSHEEKLRNKLHVIGAEYRNAIFRSSGIDNYSPFFNQQLVMFCLKMPGQLKFNKGNTRFLLKNFLNKYLPFNHAYRPTKANLAHGLVNNFTFKDVEIILNEFKELNPILESILDTKKLQLLVSKAKKLKLNEREILNLVIFVNANHFLNFLKSQ
tara:strand:- start:2196 stop:3896 length:1701 start_codon:yes stop_codon:yes gene_type:complete